MRKVVAGGDPGGISVSAKWEGGGGFRELRVEPQAFEVADVGGLRLVTIADGVDDDRLAAAVAANLGYDVADDEAPFVGRKGRSRLAVVRGLVDVELVSSLLTALNADETLLIAGTSIDPDARTRLREHSRGSRILRVPADIFPAGGVIR